MKRSSILAAFFVLWAGQTGVVEAATSTGVLTEFEREENGVTVTIDEDFDSVSGPSGAPPPRSVFASIQGASHRANASMDPFGNLALDAVLFSEGTLRARAFAIDDGFINPFGTPRRVTSSVIVDGGFLRVLGLAGASASIEVAVSSNIGAISSSVFDFNGGFTVSLVMDSDFGTATLTTSGEPLPIREPDLPIGNERIIDFALVEFDFGVVGPGERFGIRYDASLELFSPSFAELIEGQYLDPVSVVFGGPRFSPVDATAAVPVPPAGALALGALAFAVGLGRLRSRRRQGQG